MIFISHSFSLYLSDCSQTKTGIYLMQEGNEEPFNIRLHLAKDILTIQEQDVICVSGEPFYSSVSNCVIKITCNVNVNQTLCVPVSDTLPLNLLMLMRSCCLPVFYLLCCSPSTKFTSLHSLS